MRLLIDQLATANPAHVRIAEELSQRHDIVYWIRMNLYPIDKARFPKTIFHDYHQALKNIAPSEIDASTFEPVSTEAIERLAPWESEIMSMMDKWYPRWSVNQRKDFYYGLLRYWSGVIDTVQPDAIIFNAPPHQMFNFVLYALAQERHIKTLVFDVTFRLDRLILYRDYKRGNETLIEAARAGFKPTSLDSLPSYVQQYYQRESLEPNPSPSYVADFMHMHQGLPRLQRRIAAYWPHIKDGSIFERAVTRVFKIIRPDLKDIYRQLSTPADFTKSYVYVPLQFQPESTTSPQAGIYVDQIQMIRVLASALPEGWELYVKEHPAQWKINGGDFTPFRYPDFYKTIAQIPHVRLVPITTSTFALSDHAQTTATPTGSAGWESIVRGKCALIFGYPWYAQAPGAIRVGSVAQCRAAFERIVSGYRPDKQELFAYLSLYDQVTIPGRLIINRGEENASDANEWQGMYEAIERELQ